MSTRLVLSLPLFLFTTLILSADPTSPTTSPSPKPTPTSPAKKPATPAKPDTSAKEPSPNDSPVIVHGATRAGNIPDDTAASVTVVTRQDLEDHQYTSVPEALTQIPGLAVVTNGVPGQVTSLFTRGTQSADTLITIDGRRQAVGLSGADDNLTNLTLDNVDRIEDVRTGNSTVNGGNTIGGVVNIVTLSGRGLAKPESSVFFEGGSYDTFREGVQSRGAFDNFDYAVGASREDSEFDRDNNGYRNTAYRGNFGYEITKNLYFDLHTSYQNTVAGSPGSTFYPDPVANLLIEDWNISPGLTWKATDFYTTKVYYTRDQQRQTYQDPVPFYPTDTHQQINTDLFDWQNDFQIARNWHVTAGIQGDNQHVDLHDNIAQADVIGNSLFTIGGYVESQWQPIEGLNVLNSVRYDAFSDYVGAVSWRQGVSYVIAPTKTLLHVSGSSAYTAPPTQDLYYPGFANPNLKPQKALGWEFGLEQPFWKDRLSLTATYFHNHYTNFIQPDENFIPQDIPQAATEGVELGLKARPIDDLTLNFNYTYTNADNVTDMVRLIRRPRQMFNGDAVWNPIAPLTFTVGGSWMLDRQDPTNTDIANYFTLRASGTWRINSTVEIWARGENILNEKYQPVYGYPALGATGYAGVRVHF